MIPDFNKILDKSIDIWLWEDIGDGDHTTLSTIPINAEGKANLISKDHGVVAGIFAIKKIMHKFDSKLKLTVIKDDGSTITPGDVIYEVKGSVHSILQTERLCLNLLQRLSAVSTQTRKYTEKLSAYKTKILDTRKTTPGLRFLEKEAVKLGGGNNHRTGLYDMILVKDNHIDFAGGIENAIKSVHEYLRRTGKTLKVEIEARSLDDVKTILNQGGVDRILLDNFSPENTRKAVQIIGGKCETESSGGITYDNLTDYAECGVDYISVGALTHQIQSLDLSLVASF